MSNSAMSFIVALLIIVPVLASGTVIGLLTGDELDGMSATVVSFIIVLLLLLVGGSILFRGTLCSTLCLNFHGKITYRVLPFFQSDKEGFEILRIAEGGSTNVEYTGLFYKIDTKRIRGGAEAIPRDGTPFKFVKGVDGNDIVVVKVPHENNAVSVQHSVPLK